MGLFKSNRRLENFVFVFIIGLLARRQLDLLFSGCLALFLVFADLASPFLGGLCRHFECPNAIVSIVRFFWVYVNTTYPLGTPSFQVGYVAILNAHTQLSASFDCFESMLARFIDLEPLSF